MVLCLTQGIQMVKQWEIIRILVSIMHGKEVRMVCRHRHWPKRKLSNMLYQFKNRGLAIASQSRAMHALIRETLKMMRV